MKSKFERPAVIYMITLGGALVVYAVVLVASLLWLKSGVPEPWKYAVAVMPVLPALGIPFAVVRFFHSMDELQRRIQLEGLAFGFASTAIATFTYGFLQNADLPQVSWVWVWPVMGVCWIVGLLIARRSYQ